jgi:hypothetical protein
MASVGALTLLMPLACSTNGDSPDLLTLKVAIHVESDPGVPLAGANVVFNGRTITTSNDNGVAKLDLRGRQGDEYEVAIVCPSGFESPAKGFEIAIQKLADPTKPPEYDVKCTPETRTAVVAIRAENGANLPVRYLGREVARTDRWGAAHVVVPELKRDGQFELELDTGVRGAEQLRPQRPTQSFTLRNRDDVFVFDQRFTIEARVVKHPVHYRPPGPVALPTRAMP